MSGLIHAALSIGPLLSGGPARFDDELRSGEAVVFELDETEPTREFEFRVEEDSVLWVFASSKADLTLSLENLEGNSLAQAQGSERRSACIRIEVDARDEIWTRVTTAHGLQPAQVTLKVSEFRRLSEEEIRVLREAVGLRDRASSLLQAEGPLAARNAAQRALSLLRTLPDDHPGLQSARHNLAATLRSLGDLQGAQALLEKVLEVLSRTLPDDHPHLQLVRDNLAGTLRSLGDLRGALALDEKVLEVSSRTLPDDHLHLQGTRLSLAMTLHSLGDLQGARALQEKVLEVFSRTLPDDHPDLQMTRLNLAMTLHSLGDLQGAQALNEKVLAVFSRTLPDDHPRLQSARHSLAATLVYLGDHSGARALQEKVLEILSRTLPEDHPKLQPVRNNLALTLRSLGDLQGARALQEKVLEAFSRTLPDDHPHLQWAREDLAWTRARSDAWEAATKLATALAQGTSYSMASLGSSLVPRELEALATAFESSLNCCLSLSRLALEPDQELALEVFRAVETARASAVTLQRTMSAVESEGHDIEALRREVFSAAVRATHKARAGTGPARDPADESGGVFDAVRRKEAAERELQRRLASLARDQGVSVRCGSDEIAESLGREEAAVGYWRYSFVSFDRDTGEELPPEPSYLAYVLRRDQPLARVELGPAAEIDAAIKAWRRAIRRPAPRGLEPAVDESTRDPAVVAGSALRALIFDPLRGPLGDADTVNVALDDALHLVPLAALPDGDRMLGDSYELVHRPTLKELTIQPRRALHPPSLLAFGDVAYQERPRTDPAETASQSSVGAGTIDSRDGAPQSTLQSSAWRNFPRMDWTGVEANSVAGSLRLALQEVSPPITVRKGARASREAFERLAGSVRYLHLATHGYFTDESVPSMRDDRVLDHEMGFQQSLSHREQVRGFSPMVLCGLAFAGANLPANDRGFVEGVMTAEELAQMDLSRCELAVLSACDTNVGERRAGQGIASLQQALFAAGARASITSLWQVPDHATQELMSEFYRRWWVLGESKHDALWSAQRKLRDARDEFGDPRYELWHWAAWILSGDPD